MAEREVKELTPQGLIGMEEGGVKAMLVDVRDSDFGNGGFIKGAVNIPSMLFNLEVATDVIAQAKAEDMAMIVFYCQFGQQRSVKVAKTVNSVLCKQTPIPLIQIAFLKGGFEAFFKAYHGTDHVVNSKE